MTKAGQNRARAKDARLSPSHTHAGGAQLTLWGALVEPVVRLLRGKRDADAAKALPQARSKPQAQPKPVPGDKPAPADGRTGARAKPSRVRVVGVLTLPSGTMASAAPAPAKRGAGSKAELYERMTREMLATHGIRVRKWRTSMSGVAWYVTYRDGRVVKLIESPKPRSPMSAAIFLHEVGHHVLGIGAYKPRCLEEYHAWMYSLEQMRRWGIEVTPRVERRVQRSLKYAVGKATRRGIREVPEELRRYA